MDVIFMIAKLKDYSAKMNKYTGIIVSCFVAGFKTNDNEHVMPGVCLLQLQRGMTDEEKAQMDKLKEQVSQMTKLTTLMADELQDISRKSEEMEQSTVQQDEMKALKKKVKQLEKVSREIAGQQTKDMQETTKAMEETTKAMEVLKEKNTELEKSNKALMIWKQEQEGGGDIIEVETFANGATLAFLYLLALKCEGAEIEGVARSLQDRFTFFSFFMATIPLVLQYIMLALLQHIVRAVQEDDGSDPENLGDRLGDSETRPGGLFVIAASIVFIYDLFTFFFGPSFKCLVCVSRMHYQNGYQKIIAWALYVADLGVGLVAFMLGIDFLARSESGEDLVLNVVALHFILDVDDYFAICAGNICSAGRAGMGKLVNLEVPVKLQTVDVFNDKDVLSKVTQVMGRIALFGFVFSPWIPGTVAVVAYGAVNGFDLITIILACSWFVLVPVFLKGALFVAKQNGAISTQSVQLEHLSSRDLRMGSPTAEDMILKDPSQKKKHRNKKYHVVDQYDSPKHDDVQNPGINPFNTHTNQIHMDTDTDNEPVPKHEFSLSGMAALQSQMDDDDTNQDEAVRGNIDITAFSDI